MNDYKITYQYTDTKKTYSYEIMQNNEEDVIHNLLENSNPKFRHLIKVLSVIKVK